MKLSHFIYHVLETVKDTDRELYIPIATMWHAPAYKSKNPFPCRACLGGLYAAAKSWVLPWEHLMPGDPSRKPRADISLEKIETIILVENIRRQNWELSTEQLGRIRNVTLTKPSETSNLFPIYAGYPQFHTWEEFDIHTEALFNKAQVFEAANL